MNDQIANTIQSIDPLDETERKHKQFVTKWIASGAELCRLQKPATPDTHLVSYFIPFDEAQQKILLVHHKKANLWLPPGGHVDKGETPQQTAAREMEEELFTEANFLQNTPLFLTVTQTVNDTSPHTDVSLWYLVKGDAEKEYTFDDREFHAIRWFPLDQLPQTQVEPHLSRFCHKLTTHFMSYTP